MTVEYLEKELKEGKLNSIYLLYGEETFLIETVVKKIKKLFGEMIVGINYIQIDETNINTLIDNINIPAFGYEKKLIIVKNSTLFGKLEKKKITKTKTKKANVGADDPVRPSRDTALSLQDNITTYIKENINEIKETTVIIFIEEKVQESTLLDTIRENGVTCSFERLKPIEITGRLKAISAAYKVTIDNDTLRYLIETSGTSMQVLINEIRKLIEYVGTGGTITKEDVDKLAIKQLESIIFDLTDNLGQKHIKEALEIFKNLIYNKEPVEKILITLYNHFKKLYLVKLSEKYGKDIKESLKLKPNQIFLVSKYKKQASYFKEEELRILLEELINLDSNYKIGLIDKNIGLEAVLCKYCS